MHPMAALMPISWPGPADGSEAVKWTGGTAHERGVHDSRTLARAGMSDMAMSRRHALTLFGATLTLAACGREDRGKLLRVGSQRGGTKALMLSSGALDGIAYAVEWSEFPAAQTLLEAIGGGAIDMGLTGDAPFQFAYQSGSPIRAVSAQRTDPRPFESVALIVPAQSPVRTLADLRGKRIATTRGSIGHYLALRALAQAGLPLDAVIFTWLSPGDTKAAFSSGAVDGWATWAPYLSAAIKEGARVVADGHDLISGYGFEVANDTAIATKAALLRDFLRRESHALTWAGGNRDAYARVLAGETGLPADIARTMVDKNLRQAVPIDDRVIADQQEVLDAFRKAGETRGERPIDQAFWREG